MVSGSMTEKKEANSGDILKEEVVRFDTVSIQGEWDGELKDNLCDKYVFVLRTRSQLMAVSSGSWVDAPL